MQKDNRMDTTALLRRSELFTSTTDELLSSVAALATPIRFGRTDALFEQGGKADQVYLLEDGVVGIRFVTPEQGEVLVDTITKPGEVFGWSGLVAPFEYSFTARAMADGGAVALPGAELLELLREHPEVGMEVYRGLLLVVADRLQQTRSSLLSILSRGTISQG